MSIELLDKIYNEAAYYKCPTNRIKCVSLNKAKEAFIQQFGQDRIRRVGSLYDFNFSKLKKLTAYHVEALHVGLKEHCTIHCLKEQLEEGQKLQDLTGSEIQECLEKKLYPEERETMRARARATGKCFFLTMWESMFHHAFYRDEARLINLKRYFSLKNPHRHAYVEMLAKEYSSYVTVQLQEGTIIPAPYDKKGNPRFYQICKKIVTGRGMVALGLAPLGKQEEDAPLTPIIVFRGSKFMPGDLDCLSSFIMDLEKNIAEKAYKSGRALIYQLTEDLRKNGPVRFLGFSAGGAMAQQAFVDNHHEGAELMTWNSPGVSKQVTESFKQCLDKVRVHHYRNKSDAVHCGGHSLVGRGCEGTNFTRSLTYLTKQNGAPFDNPHGEVALNTDNPCKILSVKKDDLDRKMYSKKLSRIETWIRRPLGFVLRPFLIVLRAFLRAFGWIGNRTMHYTSLFRQNLETGL